MKTAYGFLVYDSLNKLAYYRIVSDPTPTHDFSKCWGKICESEAEYYEDASKKVEATINGYYPWLKPFLGTYYHD